MTDECTGEGVQSMTGGKTILIVEDTEDIRESLQMLLEDEGYHVLLAANGLEALEKLRGGVRPNVILLDLNMPVMDGQEFLQSRMGEGLAPEIPVLVFAATCQQISLPGVVDWLAKPVDISTLLSGVERWCD